MPASALASYPFHSRELGHPVHSPTELSFFRHLQSHGYAYCPDLGSFNAANGKAYTTATGTWPVKNNRFYTPDAYIRTPRGKVHVIEIKTEGKRPVSLQKKAKYLLFADTYVRAPRGPFSKTVSSFRQQFNGAPLKFHWVSSFDFKGERRGWLRRLGLA